MSLLTRLSITFVFIALWFATQRALSTRVAPSKGIDDKIHNWSARLNKKLLDDPKLSRWLLITSSLGIDLLGLWICYDSIFGASFQPMFGLFVLFSLRQLCQYLTALPEPNGMIWHHPGVPSIFVTYGVSNDLFFSGHTAIAVYGGLHLLSYQSPIIQGLAVFLIIYEILTVLILRAHWTLDVFTGIITALWASQITKDIAPMFEAWILHFR